MSFKIELDNFNLIKSEKNLEFALKKKGWGPVWQVPGSSEVIKIGFLVDQI